MKKEFAKLFALCLTVCAAQLGRAQVSAFSYQGRLIDNGVPANGNYDMQFGLYDIAGNLQGAIIPASASVSNGLFTINMNFGSAVFDGSPRLLDVAVRPGGSSGAFISLVPRQPILSAPYAIRAANFSGPVAASQLTGIIPTDNIGPFTISTANLQNECVIGSKIAANQVVRSVNGLQDSVTLAAGPNATLTQFGNTLTFSSSGVWKLGGNPGTIPGIDFLGTTDNTPLVIVAGGIPALRIAPGSVPNLVGGYAQNNSGSAIGSAIAGGGDVGAANQIQGNYGFIGAGKANKAGTMAAVPGGQGNVASGTTSLAAGSSSIASGSSSVALGEQAVASGNDAVALGSFTSAANPYSMAAGHRAKANHSGSFVWADSTEADFISTASDQFSIRAVSGVRLNFDTSMFFGNQPRQMLNLWGTDYGIGMQASTEYFRSASGFCWFKGGVHADNPNDPGFGGTEVMRLTDQGGLHLGGPGGELSLRNRDSLSVYVPSPSNGERWTLYSRNELGSGRLYFWSGNDKAALDNAGNMYANTFTPTSDRNAKENFSPVDPEAVLERVAALPISRWNFKQDVGSTHIGPMAQDFYSAFGVGPDDKHIATVDADGVALAAIQGLNQKVEAQETELKRMQSQIAELQHTLERLQGLLSGRHTSNFASLCNGGISRP